MNNFYGLYKNVVNNGLIFYNGKLLVFWEVGLFYEIRVFSLEIIGLYLCDGYLDFVFIVYLKIDFMIGELIFFGYVFDVVLYLKYGIILVRGELL